MEGFTPAPRNNGHAKPTVLPRPTFRPQQWPYSKVRRTTTSSSQEDREPPHWTYNPPSKEDIDSAMITHFQVRPASSQDSTQVGEGEMEMF